MRAFAHSLPIDSALPEFLSVLDARNCAVLIAPPGAGKTTRIPLALLEAPWAVDKKIVILEPRRLAARAAAARMAQELGERVGETVGLRIRMERKESARTRILVVTEGVFSRMILDDPELTGIAAVLFDEFHERSLDADLGLALALDAQTALREDLRLVAMSATLEGGRVAALMNDAQIVASEGRAYPIREEYLGRDPAESIESAMARAIFRALDREQGSILAFLPGQREIERVARDLDAKLNDPKILVAPLYGALEKRDQDRAIAPAPAGTRKIVLATSVAETSLTIESVRIVIDSGLARVPRFEPDLGLTRLETVRAARASVDQRRGRAGRTAPGVCYRLWEAAATGALPAFASPEIISADLSGLVLDLAEWGVTSAQGLRFLDPPPAPAWSGAQKLLNDLGAIDADGRLTQEGRRLRALPLPPRLARMVLQGARLGAGARAAQLAALLSERGLGGSGCDLAWRLERFQDSGGAREKMARKMADSWTRQALAGESGENQVAVSGRRAQESEISPGVLIACAFPDRIARQRGKPGEFVMANGRAGALEPHESLAQSEFLAVAEIAGRAAQARILAAAALTAEEIDVFFAAEISAREELSFNAARAALERRAFQKLGALTLATQNLSIPATLESARVLAEGLVGLGADRLPWSQSQAQTRARVEFLRQKEGAPWPDLSDAALKESAGDWLAPFLIGAKNLADLNSDILGQALAALIPRHLAQRLDREAPTHFLTPAGASHAIDYQSAGGPAAHMRVQELFGLRAHPRLADGKIPLTLHLLSPAHRPIQITQDIVQFWAGSWKDVRADMRGRYPKHVWPEDPASSAPTTRAKPRGG